MKDKTKLNYSYIFPCDESQCDFVILFLERLTRQVPWLVGAKHDYTVSNKSAGSFQLIFVTCFCIAWENHHCEKQGNHPTSLKLWKRYAWKILSNQTRPPIRASTVWPWSFQGICRGLWIIIAELTCGLFPWSFAWCSPHGLPSFRHNPWLVGAKHCTIPTNQIAHYQQISMLLTNYFCKG
jgi:hypothetical protein